MGCTVSKPEQSAEEEAIQLGEQTLLYENVNCIEVDRIHRKYSNSGKINLAQLLEISKKLSLASVDLLSDKRLEHFYNTFKSEESYSLNQLLVMGVLASRGTALEKAKTLFEIEDKVNSKFIKRTSVENLAKNILEVSNVNLPLIYVIEEGSKATENSIKDYSRRLAIKIAAAVPILANLFMGTAGNEISLSDFINNFRVEEVGKLVTPQAIRKFTNQQSASIEIIDVPT